MQIENAFTCRNCPNFQLLRDWAERCQLVESQATTSPELIVAKEGLLRCAGVQRDFKSQDFDSGICRATGETPDIQHLEPIVTSDPTEKLARIALFIPPLPSIERQITLRLRTD